VPEGGFGNRVGSKKSFENSRQIFLEPRVWCIKGEKNSLRETAFKEKTRRKFSKAKSGEVSQLKGRFRERGKPDEGVLGEPGGETNESRR